MLQLQFQWRPLQTCTGPENASESDIVGQISYVRRYFRELKTEVLLETSKARYERSWIAGLFCMHKTARNSGVGSLGLLFARNVLSASRQEGCTDKQLQGKWKNEMLINKFWHSLHREFRCGIFSLVSDKLKDE
jgi:hypothetical protein